MYLTAAQGFYPGMHPIQRIDQRGMEHLTRCSLTDEAALFHSQDAI